MYADQNRITVMRLLGCLPCAHDIHFGTEDHELSAPNPQLTSDFPQLAMSVSHKLRDAFTDGRKCRPPVHHTSANIEEPKCLQPGAIETAYISPPLHLNEDIEWGFSQAIYDHGLLNFSRDWSFLPAKSTKDDLKSQNVKSHLGMPTSTSQYSDLEDKAEELKISFSTEIPYAEPSSLNQRNNTREILREELRINMERLRYGASNIQSQLESEGDMYQFCTLFPKYYEFERDELARLWMATEFVTDKKLIDCYFNALVKEGYILHVSKCYPSGESVYRVNVNKMVNTRSTRKLLYRRVSKRDFLAKAHERLEYISVEHIDETTFNQIKKFQRLKVLLFVGMSDSKMHQSSEAAATRAIVKIPYDLFLSLKHLKVLDLSGVPVAELPSSIGKAKELRYIDLSFSLVEQLPETIDCLNLLQTLRLRGCHRLYKLPEGIVKLSSLRHLDLDILSQLSFLPKHMGMLTSLETLSAFLVDKDDGHGISELKLMNNLKGRICISGLERVLDVMEASEASLYNKNLNVLELRWCAPKSEGTKAKQHHTNVLQQLRPPASLEHLEISGYGGLKFPIWLNGFEVHALVGITLASCVNAKYLPSLGEFPRLKIVHLIDITGVKNIGDEFRGQGDVAFPELEELVIVGMSSLEKWKEGKEGDFPHLRKLTIEQCPKLITIPPVLSSLDCLKHFEISNCAKLSSLSLHQRHLPVPLDLHNIQNAPSVRKHCKDWLKIPQVQKVCSDDQQFTHVR